MAERRARGPPDDEAPIPRRIAANVCYMKGGITSIKLRNFLWVSLSHKFPKSLSSLGFQHSNIMYEIIAISKNVAV
jgi:hypothetical protein